MPVAVDSPRWTLIAPAPSAFYKWRRSLSTATFSAERAIDSPALDSFTFHAAASLVFVLLAELTLVAGDAWSTDEYGMVDLDTANSALANAYSACLQSFAR